MTTAIIINSTDIFFINNHDNNDIYDNSNNYQLNKIKMQTIHIPKYYYYVTDLIFYFNLNNQVSLLKILFTSMRSVNSNVQIKNS